MNTFIIYKGIKQRLAGIAPVFYYIGQYLKASDKTSYKVPAIYIEMPKNLQTDFFRRTIMVAKGAEVKIHLVTNAPYSAHDNAVQDSAIQEHQTKLESLDKLMTGFVLRDANQLLLTQQFIPIGANNMNFDGVKVYSVLTYTTEFYSRHLQ